MAVVFSPTPTEWIALIVCLLAGGLSAVCFIITAFAFHWKEWYLRVGMYHPKYLIPELYGFVRTLIILMIGLAGFYVLRALLEADLATTPITNASARAALILFIILLGLTGSFGFMFFWVGLTLSWMIVACFWEFATMAVCIVMTYYFWVISLAAGILGVIASTFFLISFIITCCYYKFLVMEGKHMDPFAFMMNITNAQTIKTRVITENVKQSNKEHEMPHRNINMYPASSSDSTIAEPYMVLSNESYDQFTTASANFGSYTQQQQSRMFIPTIYEIKNQ